ncbi:MAG TPA: hypothetical protein VF658_06630 [Pyrinomonadaceae bacterium]|jgi:hypothetical protein
MSEINVSFSGNSLAVDERSWQVEYPVLQTFALGEKIIVLYDPDAQMEKFGQFPNLVAFNSAGEKLWVAQLPTNESGDCYWRIYFEDGLMADSFKSFSCRIDEASGKIKSRVFYK